jgi:hypothetical protein
MLDTTGSWKIQRSIEIVDAAIVYAFNDIFRKSERRIKIQLNEEATYDTVIEYYIQYWLGGHRYQPYCGNLGRIILRKLGPDVTHLTITDTVWRDKTPSEIFKDSYWSPSNNYWRQFNAQSQKSEINLNQEVAVENTNRMINLRDQSIVDLINSLMRDDLLIDSRQVIKPAIIPGLEYIDIERINELRQINKSKLDLSRLIRICEEINVCFAEGCYLATAMLVRSMLDHVPPIFEKSRFAEVVNNYNGGKSFRESMQNLENSSRKIGDSHLHVQVRSKEILPNKTQVNFSNDIDVLLAEIVRLLK